MKDTKFWQKLHFLKSCGEGDVIYFCVQEGGLRKEIPGGALPYVGGYQVPVSRPPFFTPTLHPMTPFFI